MNERIDNAPLKEYLAVVIAYIIGTREAMNRPPMLALHSNICNVISQNLGTALSEMEREGVLTRRVTLNEDAYEFTPPDRSRHIGPKL